VRFSTVLDSDIDFQVLETLQGERQGQRPRVWL